MRADRLSTVSSGSTLTTAWRHDRAGVEVARDEVDRRARKAHAVLERLTLRVDAGECRQQRRVDVEDGVWKGVEQRRPDEPHEAGQAHEPDTAVQQRHRDRAVERITRGERAVIEDDRLDAASLGPGQAGRPGAVRDHDGDPGPELAAGDGVDERLKVAAPAGNQDPNRWTVAGRARGHRRLDHR